MPNTTPAAGEAMPTFTRRKVLGLMAAAAIPPSAALAAAPIGDAAVAVENYPHYRDHDDPLLDAVNAYRAGMADFNANAPTDTDEANAYAEISWMPPFDALKDWTAPATTREGAMAALRLAVEEAEHSHSELNYPLIAAALAYLEQEGAR